MKKEDAEKSAKKNTTSITAVKRSALETNLYKALPKLEKVATKHLQPERLIQLALRSIARNPKILECTPTSVLGCVFESQTLGLEIDSLGQGYIVPFKNRRGQYEAQFIAGYKGLINLAQRTGNIASIHADLVTQEEWDSNNFDYSYGNDYFLRHRPSLKERDKDFKDIILVYAYAKLKDGGFYFVVVPKVEIEKTRLRSPSGKSSSSAWATDWDEMAKKTAIRKLSKYLPMSIEFERALRLDEMVALGQPQNLDVNKISEVDGTLLIGEESAIQDDILADEQPEPTEPSKEPEPKKETVKLPKANKGGETLFADENSIENWENVEFVLDKIKDCVTLDDVMNFKNDRKADLDRFGGKDAERIDSAILSKVRKLRGI